MIQLPEPPQVESIEQEWMREAACVGYPTAWWFPGRGDDLRPAKKICAACPVRVECIEYALETGSLHGIFGGLSHRQRLKWKKEQDRMTRGDAAA